MTDYITRCTRNAKSMGFALSLKTPRLTRGWFFLMQLCSYRIDVRLQDNLHDIRERIPAFRQQPTVCKATMNFTDDSRLIVSGFAFLEFAPLECFSQKCIEDLEIGSSIDDYFFSSTFFRQNNKPLQEGRYKF